MQRDKTLSHEKVKKAVKEEFLEKGYEDASIRSILARAGMTSAGLYRHYADKEAIFNAMVDNGYQVRRAERLFLFSLAIALRLAIANPNARMIT
ncbi:MAG: TetR/AcrR family transcriptional regulator [Lachnospiraceae bacterium]|nr:TetR/AcrR family transcriptional regulator [Lachnospiraceae bacterium]